MKFRNSLFKLGFAFAVSMSAITVAPAYAQTSDAAAYGH